MPEHGDGFSLGTNVHTPFFQITQTRIWAQCLCRGYEVSTLHSGTRWYLGTWSTQCLKTTLFWPCLGTGAPSVNAALDYHSMLGCVISYSFKFEKKRKYWECSNDNNEDEIIVDSNDCGGFDDDGGDTAAAADDDGSNDDNDDGEEKEKED